jgi:hypothetical protein
MCVTALSLGNRIPSRLLRRPRHPDLDALIFSAYCSGVRVDFHPAACMIAAKSMSSSPRSCAAPTLVECPLTSSANRAARAFHRRRRAVRVPDPLGPLAGTADKFLDLVPAQGARLRLPGRGFPAHLFQRQPHRFAGTGIEEPHANDLGRPWTMKCRFSMSFPYVPPFSSSFTDVCGRPRKSVELGRLGLEPRTKALKGIKSAPQSSIDVF